MSTFEWSLVFLINGAIILFGLWKSRETNKSVDWFLAARNLPWWMVGLSMFATAVDSGDYVAVAGAAYRDGMPYISAWWIGMTTGWLIVAWFVLVPMYRSGMFTNCEYLEARFGPATRVIAVLVQIQTRTNVLGNVAFSLYLTFEMLTGWGLNTWWLVGGIALGAAIYTSLGGLKSVALTDSIQSIVMLVAAVILWWAVWNAVGGWSGLESRLDEHVSTDRLSAAKAHAMTHIGGESAPGIPPLLVVFGYTVVLTSYCVINQSQAMRMLAARSDWDLRMAAVAAATVTVIVMWFNVTLGVMGRALFPELDTPDDIFPKLVQEFMLPLQSGLAGIVVAGLLAGGISTYDSIGSALASVFTRDIYARFMVRNAEDSHYLRVSRIVTYVVIALSFAYVPFLKSGMVAIYMKLIGVAAVPLLTVYLMGIFTRVNRGSGTFGLLTGISLGMTRLLDPLLDAWFGKAMPSWWTSTWWGYLWSIGITAVAMLVFSVKRGFATSDEISRISERATDQPRGEHNWLDDSRLDVPEVPQYPFDVPADGLPWFKQVAMWTVALVVVVCMLNLVILW